MEVDHIIPESLENDSAKLKAVRVEFGLPEDFDLTSYENWMPACTACNNKKRALVFKSTPIVQAQLQRATEKAPVCREIERETVGKRRLANALNVIQRAARASDIKPDIVAALVEEFERVLRKPEVNEFKQEIDWQDFNTRPGFGRPMNMLRGYHILRIGPGMSVRVH